MDFPALLKDLKDASTAKRKLIWTSLPQKHGDHPFSPSEVRQLQGLLFKESDWDVRTTGMLCLIKLLHMAGPELQESFQSWLFSAFRSHLGEPRALAKRSIVVSVCDDEYIRDMQAQVELARHLPSDRYPHTEFQHVALHSPNWAHVGLNRAEAICFIGRPSMFMSCSIIDHFPHDLRFSILPKGPEETQTFNRVCQNRPKAGPLIYPTTQDASERHDHAIVQRFAITVGGQKMTIVVIAGGSSLGTFGAAQWITTFGWGEERRKEFVGVAGLDNLEQTTRVEALLEVKASVHSPARPWRAHVEEKSLFLNRSRNLLKVPNRIAVATDTGMLRKAEDVRYLLFDDDEVEFGGVDQQAAIAVCVKYLLDGQTEMNIENLIKDERLWTNGKWPGTGSPVTFFRDHLQRRGFNGIVEITQENMTLKLGSHGGIKVIRARLNSGPAAPLAA